MQLAKFPFRFFVRFALFSHYFSGKNGWLIDAVMTTSNSIASPFHRLCNLIDGALHLIVAPASPVTRSAEHVCIARRSQLDGVALGDGDVPAAVGAGPGLIAHRRH